ncbi:flagellar filament capping protein FliD [Selenomonas sputigena]|uniref:Flagellar hook-associated protein 2 n=1 Tax=Selenomonas sputigena TaxID=69823 RepID=A0ABV3X3R2_9FIRM
MGVNGIYGLSGSGLDIESLVKMGMMGKQKQYDKMYKREMTNEYTKTALNELYNQINTYNLSELTNYKKQSDMAAKSATTSNDKAVTVSANGAAAVMSHTVTVDSLATNAYFLSNAPITRSYVPDPAITPPPDHSKSIELADIAFKRIDDAGTSGGVKQYHVYYTDGTDQIVNEGDTAISFEIKDKAGASASETYTVKYTFKDLMENKKTLNDLASNIQNASIASNGSHQTAQKANFNASYDAATGSFSIYNKSGGANNVIDIKTLDKGSTQLMNNLHLAKFDHMTNSLTNLPAFVQGTSQSQGGTAGQVTIDGRQYTVDENRVVVGGVTYNLLNKTQPGESVTVSVSQNVDAVVDKVKKFVESYNKLIDNLQEKYSTQHDKDYDPLTKEQEKSMSEEQIKRWNEKAKGGLLYHNTYLGRLISKMRESVYTPVASVESKYNSASTIGITTQVGNNKGHLKLDEDKLKKALADDPDCVYRIFGSMDEKDDFKNSGVSMRLSQVALDSMKEISKEGGIKADWDDSSTLGNLIRQQKQKMKDFKNLLDDFQDQLYKKYDAMESALQQMNSMYNSLFGAK